MPTTSTRRWWKFHFRDWDDEDEQDWWFASTAIPLLAATIGPLANVLSIAALVTSWRMCLVANVEDAAVCRWDGDGTSLLPQLQGQDYSDERWCYWLNVVSLIVGFVGNFFLLCNFTNRIRYIIALPVTIGCWYVATGILLGIIVAVDVYTPPRGPEQIYTQGFWYAVIAACMYCICAMLLMVNMLGYFLGHYPQHFTLTENQRTLILQTMLFFFWLAGGGAVFSTVEQRYSDSDFDWSFVNALYFCDVTILTVGFGDLYPESNIGRGLVFPYSVGGIIMLGLMVSSISTFARELGSEKVVRRHVERSRVRTFGRTVTTSLELERRKTLAGSERLEISAPFNPRQTNKRTIGFTDNNRSDPKATLPSPKRTSTMKTLTKVGSLLANAPIPKLSPRKTKLLLLREEKDRFNAMRKIQSSTRHFKNWYALTLSILAFGILWCIGAMVFWQAERSTQNMTYFQALYFCYISLLTIGYGDLSPKSNAGRTFFVFWSLLAVPNMTILVSDLGDTVISNFKTTTSGFADFTVLPQKGIWRNVLRRYPGVIAWFQARRETRTRLEKGLPYGPAEADEDTKPTIEDLAKRKNPTEAELAAKLPKAIRRVTGDLRDSASRRKFYSYEEWVEFTQLIRFTAARGERDSETDVEQDMVEWDWIGEDSPMMAKQSEAEFVLDRLCESLARYVARKERRGGGGGGGGGGVIRTEEEEEEEEESTRNPTARSKDVDFDGNVGFGGLSEGRRIPNEWGKRL